MSKMSTNQSERGCSAINTTQTPSNYVSNRMCDDDDAEPFGEKDGRCTAILTLLPAAVWDTPIGIDPMV